MVTQPQVNLVTCYTIFTVEKFILTITRPQEREGWAKWQNMYCKILCRGEERVQATETAYVQLQ